MVDKLLEVGVSVLEVFSLHGGIDDDKQDQKQGQVSSQRLHTECVENSLLSSGNIRETMTWKRS